jgi:ABC-type antimicrobial peptide transport system permease subunit
MVVNQQLADFYWPGEEAIGKCVKVAADSLPCVTIVGMVANGRNYEIQEKPRAMYYMPLAQAVNRQLNADRILFVRAAGDPKTVMGELRALYHQRVANLPAPNIRTFQSQIDPEVRPWRLGAVMFGVFGALALLVAAIGLYSVMSYLVAQRTHELGIRHALGAAPRDIVAMVTREGIGVILAGMGIGMLLALVLARYVQPMLYQTSARDPGTLLLVSTVLLGAATAATIIPAIRATRVDPLEALRSE